MNNIIAELGNLREEIGRIRIIYLKNIIKDNFSTEDIQTASVFEDRLSVIFRCNVFLIMNSDMELVIYFLNREWSEDLSHSDIIMNIRYYIDNVCCTGFNEHREKDPMNYDHLPEAQRQFLNRNKNILNGLR